MKKIIAFVIVVMAGLGATQIDAQTITKYAACPFKTKKEAQKLCEDNATENWKDDLSTNNSGFVCVFEGMPEAKKYCGNNAIEKQIVEGGSAVLCQTRTTKTKFATVVKSCSKEAQESACQTDEDLADPVDCKSFATNEEIGQFLAANPLRFGIQCQLKLNGIGFRAMAPTCSPDIIKSICMPDGTIFNSCTDFKQDVAGLAKWSKEAINKAWVKCKLDVAKKTYDVPALDCSEATKNMACPSGISKPTGCTMRPYPKLGKGIEFLMKL
jgi:hypothetical protein